MKPVYQISIDGEFVGYIGDKNKFEQTIYETFNNNEEENIAFADFDAYTSYEFKLIERQQELNEEEIILALKEKADITYFEYTVCINGEEKENFKSIEQANEVVEKLNEEFGEEIDISIKTAYTRKLEIEENVDIATIYENLAIEVDKQIQEEQKKEKATIDGVYIAVVPVQGNITSRYGSKEAVRDHEHKGLDIATKTGTPIKAAASGTVIFSGTMGGYGNLIIIDHGNGITTYYGHCSKLYKEKGENVTAGDVIAAVGSTGNSTGSHLHFEIRKNGVYVDPAQYLFV